MNWRKKCAGCYYGYLGDDIHHSASVEIKYGSKTLYVPEIVGVGYIKKGSKDCFTKEEAMKIIEDRLIDVSAANQIKRTPFGQKINDKQNEEIKNIRVG